MPTRGRGVKGPGRQPCAPDAARYAQTTAATRTVPPEAALETRLSPIDALGARLGAARDFDAALDLLAEEARQLGFDGVDYAYLPSVSLIAGGWAAGPVFARNFPRRWQVGWARYGRHDPILPLCFRRGLPVDWQAVRCSAVLSEPQRAAVDFLESGMGFPGGITVPIHLPGNRFAFVSGVSARRGAEWDALSARAMAPLMVLAHTFHHFVAVRCPAPGAESPARLTRRETECLQHAADGYSAPASARMQHRSVETVRGHLKRAMGKLGARTIAQSVAVAAACGLIDAALPPAPATKLGQAPEYDPIGS
jgi:LuxR family transcriptional regulator